MQKVINRTLSGKIVETSTIQDDYNREIYQVTFMRADNRKMTISVDRDIYDKCIDTNRKVIFDIDVVMEKEGDINNYDKILTKAKKALFLGTDIDEKEFTKKMEEDLVWLSRYAKPLPAEKSKAKKAISIIDGYFGIVCFYVILFGMGIGAILFIPLTINNRKAQADKYANYEVTKGEVIKQSNRQDSENGYIIQYEIEYWVNDEKYVIRDHLDYNTSSIMSQQYVLYNKDEPSDGMLCGYNSVAKAYLPGLQESSEYVGFVVMAIVGVALILLGIIFLRR